VSDDEIEAVSEPGRWVDVFDDPALAALKLADAMSGETHSLDPALTATLREQFTEAQLAELILVAGQANLNNRAGNAAKQLLGPAPSD